MDDPCRDKAKKAADNDAKKQYESEYKGMQNSTKCTESSAQKAYDEFMDDPCRDKAKKAADNDAKKQYESEYKGMQNSKGGIDGMLEVIESDFARLEADTKSAESSAQM